MKAPDVYWHVGLPKTGTTYLQHRFFPKLQGLHYLHRTKHDQSVAAIEKAKQNHAKVLYSRECGTALERECQRLSEHHPEIRPMIVLRRQDRYLASHYRRNIKNGISRPLKGFLDLDNDEGFWKKQEFVFMDKLKMLEHYFQCAPLVLFHEELKNDPYTFFDRIAQFTGTTYNKSDVSLKPFHASHSEKQLKFMRRFGKYYLPQKKRTGPKPNFVFKFMKDRGRLLGAHAGLWVGRVLPESWVDDSDLMNPDELERVREYYAKDWQACLGYAQAHNPSATFNETQSSESTTPPQGTRP